MSVTSITQKQIIAETQNLIFYICIMYRWTNSMSNEAHTRKKKSNALLLMDENSNECILYVL